MEREQKKQYTEKTYAYHHYCRDCGVTFVSDQPIIGCPNCKARNTPGKTLFSVTTGMSLVR